MQDTEVLPSRAGEGEGNFCYHLHQRFLLIVFAESHPGSISIIPPSARDADRTESVALFRFASFEDLSQLPSRRIINERSKFSGMIS